MKRFLAIKSAPHRFGPMIALLCLGSCQGGGGSGRDHNSQTDLVTPAGGQVVPANQIYAGRPANPSCKAFERPKVGKDELTLQRLLSGISLQQPMFAIQVAANGANDGFWLVAERNGRLLRINDLTPNQAIMAIDLTNVVNTQGEGGLLGFALHPNFQQNRQLYLSYTTTNTSGGGPLLSKLTAFTLPNSGTVTEADGQVLITLLQPYDNHNGGHIQFGPDGYLYFGLGDGGSGNDPLGAGQDKTTLLGKLLRIDVNGGSTPNRPYGIPRDNPWPNDATIRPEIFALGLRNPWRWSFDRVLGDLWVADVGQDTAEEITITTKGANLGWSPCEGPFLRGSGNAPCNLAGAAQPISWYLHQGSAKSITGGYVYRGSQIPNLQGKYLYSDYTDPTIFGLPAGLQAGQNNVGEPLLQAPGVVISFAEDANGELVILTWGNNTGRIDRIVTNPVVPTAPAAGPPLLLSATGCVEPGNPTQFVPAVIPYTPISMLWSDNASKQRGLALPDGTSLTIDSNGHLGLPIGGVLLKTFVRADTHLETRLLARHLDGTYSGLTYRWRADKSDADLVQTEQDRTISAAQWLIPNRSECMLCHTAAAGFTLGLSIDQLASPMIYGNGKFANQLAVLSYLEMLPAPQPSPNGPAWADIAASKEPLWLRSRIYLDTNCSNCHRPGSSGRGNLDLRLQIDLAATGLCNTPQFGDFALPQAMLLAPGSPQSSVLLHRMQAQSGDGRMPPLGSNQQHQAAIELLQAWIAGLTDCSNGTR